MPKPTPEEFAEVQSRAEAAMDVFEYEFRVGYCRVIQNSLLFLAFNHRIRELAGRSTNPIFTDFHTANYPNHRTPTGTLEAYLKGRILSACNIIDNDIAYESMSLSNLCAICHHITGLTQSDMRDIIETAKDL